MTSNVDALYMSEEFQVSLNPEKRLQKLIERSKPNEIAADVPLGRILRSMLEINRYGSLYYTENNAEMAFSYYCRFTTILVETLGKHPDYQTCSLPEKKKIEGMHKEVWARAVEMKNRTTEIYEKEAAALKTRLEAMKKKEEEEKRRLAAAGLTIPPVAPARPAPSNIMDQLGDLSPVVAKSMTAVNLSGQLMVDFLKAAELNTLANRETCAILSGRMSKSGFIVTHAIIPNQSGDSESCETLDEERVYDYQEEHGLISLGWIHTHPSQTAFLSSIDLHMQNSFQMLLDESIAIVCAPSYKQSAVYTLTNAGRQYLTTCRKSGHHPHETNVKLYEEATHVFFTDQSNYKVVDFRN